MRPAAMLQPMTLASPVSQIPGMQQQESPEQFGQMALLSTADPLAAMLFLMLVQEWGVVMPGRSRCRRLHG